MFNLKKISNQENIKYFIWFFITKFIIGIVTSSIAVQIDPTSTHNPIDDFGELEKIFVLLFFAPIIETLFFQFIVIELLKKTKLPTLIIISISALLFGLSHHYNLLYIIATTISGIIYSLYYCKLRSQGRRKAILWVSGLHSLSNLSALFIDFIGKD